MNKVSNENLIPVNEWVPEQQEVISAHDNCLDMETKKVFLVANGCYENQMDSAMLKRYFGESCESFEVTKDTSSADVLLVLGCSVTQHMENESSDLIKYLEEHKKPDSRVFAIGCISKLKPEIQNKDIGEHVPIQEIEGLLRMNKNVTELSVNTPVKQSSDISEFLTTRKESVIKDYYFQNNTGLLGKLKVTALSPFYNVVNGYKSFIESKIKIHSDNTHCIKVSTGCRGKCTYCSIKLSRGKVRSKAIDTVVSDLQRGLDQGFQDFALMGTDLGDYGKDNDSDLLHLLERIVSLDANFQLRLRNINPRWLIPSHQELCNLLESNKIVYIESPIQSGNERILELMKREYRASDFLEAISEIRNRSSSVILRSQLIAGFPSETESEFKDSVAVVDSGYFDYIDIFRYTKRPHRPSAKMEQEVPFNIIMQRYRKLLFKSLLNQPVRKMKAIKILN